VALLPLALLVLAALSPFTLSLTVEVDVGTVELNVGEELAVVYEGEAPIYAVVANFTEGLMVSEAEVMDGGHRGLIQVEVYNSSVRLGECLIALTSTKPFTVKVSTEEALATYNCDGNVTVMLHVKIRALEVEEGEAPMGIYVSWENLWPMLIYGALTPPFLAAALLDVKDFKARRGRRARVESLAIVLRYMTYASITCSIAVLAVTGGLALYSLIAPMPLRVEAGSLLLSSTLTGALALLYGLARWKGWYEAVDEYD